jgi:hypothetical protein
MAALPAGHRNAPRRWCIMNPGTEGWGVVTHPFMVYLLLFVGYVAAMRVGDQDMSTLNCRRR